MRPCVRINPTRWLALLGMMLCCVVLPGVAGDLPAVGDGDHLWLIQQTPPPADDQDADPTLTLYHLPADGETYRANKLDPITGELMPRGLAAGDGRLLMITNERKVLTVRPVWSDLLRSYEYPQRSLIALPEGCTLIALAMGDRGPWALVQVQSRELLEQLDQRDEKSEGTTDQQMLNRALGLPEDLDWDEPGETDKANDESADGETEEPQDEPSEESSVEETPAEAEIEAQPEPTLPAYRLIHLRSSKWVSSPLPKDFVMPREAALLIRTGDDRPTLLVDVNAERSGLPVLVRYNPVEPGDDEPVSEEQTEGDEPAEVQDATWSKLVTGMQLRAGSQWSASIVKDQVVIAMERYRPQQVVTIDVYVHRSEKIYEIGYANISVGNDAQWALLPKQNEIGLMAGPPPPPDPNAKPSDRPPTLAHLVGLTLDGQPLFKNDQGQALMMPISEYRPNALEGNADLFIQILAFITAMIMMVMFYRRAPQQNQLDLPEHLVLASFSRRAIAGIIDLSPGFILAALIYNVSISEIVFESWPGNGIDKAFAAMRPGFIVIGVTLLHTTISEFILARSIGKILMGMYVADLNGKPAPPMPCLGRALSRAFELFAPLMILVAVISPARQRLGDILARTTVVMRKPEPPPEPEDNDDY
ncbi:MAG: RDD family protein [Planctomycetota bacterium]